MSGMEELEWHTSEQVIPAEKVIPGPGSWSNDSDVASLMAIAAVHPDFLYTIDRHHRFRYASPSLLKLWGKRLDEVVGKSFEELGYPEHLVSLHEKQLNEVLQGKTVKGENAYTAYDGHTGYYEYTFVPVFDRDDDVELIVGITHDVTHRKDLARELSETLQKEREERQKTEDAVKELEKEHALREAFVATLSHDLRGPLSAARISAELVGRKTDAPGVSRLVHRIESSLDRVDNMIKDLLDVTLVRTGKPIPIEPENCDAPSILKEGLKELSTIHGDRFDVSCPARLEGAWDCNGLRRILDNLVNNAAKYGDPAATIEVRLEDKNGDAELSVRNKGEAIPEAQLSNLFSPYTRVSSRPGGWGLGLTLVRGIAEAHGGSVAVKSNAETGTEFTVFLPSIQM